MATLNKVMLMGRLTAAPDEPRTLANSGTVVVKFRLAVGRSRKNQETGQWENDPNVLYIDCEVYSRPDAKRNLADVVTRYVKQGDQLFIEGRLQLDEWQDKATGVKRSKHKVVVDSIELLGGKGSDGGEMGGAMGGASNTGVTQGNYGGNGNNNGGGNRKPQAPPAQRGDYNPPDDDGPPSNDDIPF